MDKFIVFNGGVFNTRHIVAMVKTKREWVSRYGVALHIINEIERQYFDDENERDLVFDSLVNQLLNE